MSSTSNGSLMWSTTEASGYAEEPGHPAAEPLGHHAPFTSLAEAGQVLRRTTTDSCASWNPWDPNYPHQGPMKETMTESNSSAQP